MQNDSIPSERDANNKLGLLLPDLVHEIRNLMQSVQGLAELEQRHASEPVSIGRLQKISNQASFAAELATTMLRVSNATVDNSLGDVAEAVNTAVSVLNSNFGKGVQVDCQIDEAIPPVSLPTGFLDLILLNISKNAVDALAGVELPTLKISATTEGANAVIRVWNNGPYIAPAFLERLFAANITTKGAKGHGYGLRVVRTLAEHAGGTVGVQNVPNGGVQFFVTLPCVLEQFKTQFKVTPPPKHALSGRRFLVIDDDPSVREVLSLMIKDLGGAVLACDSGAQALSLNDSNFDVILLDLRMKGLSGEQTFECLAPDLQRKVVFVTGDLVTAHTRKFIEGTVRPILIKPVSFSQLCGVVPQKAG